jgi:hypothetical protein
MFESVDGIPWREVTHAYGVATDAPGWIRAFDSDDPDMRSDAIYGFLYSSVFHQYTLYPATPFVVPFVIEALQSPSVCSRDNGMGDPMKLDLLGFVQSCAERGQRGILGVPHPQAPTIEAAVLSGAEVYLSFLSDDNPKVVDVARWLHGWCRGKGAQTP